VAVETFLRKRKSRYAGEPGLFSDSPMSEEDFSAIPMDTEVRVEMATERNLAYLKFIWGLAGIVAKNTEFYLDKDDAVDGPQGLKILVRHCKMVTDTKTGEVIIKPMSLRRLSNEAMLRLKNRMIYIVVTKLIPAMDSDVLRKEVEDYINGTKDEPQQEEPPPHEHHPHDRT
jgi:hypothetical protein